MPASIRSWRIDESGTSGWRPNSRPRSAATARSAQLAVRSLAVIAPNAPLFDDAQIRRQLALARFGAAWLGLRHCGGLGGDDCVAPSFAGSLGPFGRWLGTLGFARRRAADR